MSDMQCEIWTEFVCWKPFGYFTNRCLMKKEKSVGTRKFA